MTTEGQDESKKVSKVSRRNFVIGVGAGVVVGAAAVAGIESYMLLKPSTSTTTSTVTSTVTGPTTTVTGPTTTKTVTSTASGSGSTSTVTSTVTGPTTTVTTTSTAPPTSSSIITLNVNGHDYTMNLDNRWSLANALRLKLNLTGTKIGCERGECGACAVLVGGVPMLSCTMLAVESGGKSITTIEGIGGPEHLSPVQAALCDSDGVWCGACTPGIVIVSTAFLKANPSPTQAALADALAGNICKCANWQHVFAGLMTVTKA